MGEIQRILPRLLNAVKLIAEGQTLSEVRGQTLETGGQNNGGQTLKNWGQTLFLRGQTLKCNQF